ncbi:hypothetical protein [Microbacterium sp. NPDC057650]|uniref:hypothetical protein n=1 Tax=unclassified Microbacterium TaxID=2609290 RepID=UPI0036721636
MTRARVWIIAILAAMALALGAAAPASADEADDVLAADKALGTSLTTFSDALNDQSATAEDIQAAAETFQSEAEAAQKEFQALADGNSGVAEYAKDFAKDAGEMADAAGAIADGITNQDQAALTEADAKMSDALDDYDATADKLNEYLKTAGDPTYMGWLIVLIVAVVFLILALLFALLTRKQQGLLPAKADKKGNIQQSSLKKLRWMVVLWAAVFVVGAAIPFFQIVFAQPDASGQYEIRIFWYPLAIGVVLSIVGVIQYFIAAGKVRREGSAAAYDPNDPSTFGAVQGEGFSRVPPAESYQPVPPGYEAQGTPVPPAPAQAADATAPAAPVAEAPVAEASVAEAPAAPVDAAAPAAPVADAPAAEAPAGPAN